MSAKYMLTPILTGACDVVIFGGIYLYISAASTLLQWILKMHYKKLFTDVESHVSAMSLLESRE